MWFLPHLRLSIHLEEDILGWRVVIHKIMFIGGSSVIVPSHINFSCGILMFWIAITSLVERFKALEESRRIFLLRLEIFQFITTWTCNDVIQICSRHQLKFIKLSTGFFLPRLWRHNDSFHCCWCLLQILHFALWKVSSTKRCILWCDQERIVTSEVLNTFLSDVNVLLSGIWREQLCVNFHRFPLHRRLNQLLQQDDIRCCNDDLRNTVFRGRV